MRFQTAIFIVDSTPASKSTGRPAFVGSLDMRRSMYPTDEILNAVSKVLITNNAEAVWVTIASRG